MKNDHRRTYNLFHSSFDRPARLQLLHSGSQSPAHTDDMIPVFILALSFLNCITTQLRQLGRPLVYKIARLAGMIKMRGVADDSYDGAGVGVMGWPDGSVLFFYV